MRADQLDDALVRELSRFLLVELESIVVLVHQVHGGTDALEVARLVDLHADGHP